MIDKQKYSKDRFETLGTGRIPLLLLKFSVPAIIGMTVNAMYNVIDKIFIGNMAKNGDVGIAALQVCAPIMLILLAFSMLTTVGGTACISLALGRGEKEHAEKIIGSGTFLTAVIAIILTVFFLIFKMPLLIAFGASEETIGYSSQFLTIILIGTILNNLSFCLSRYILAQGLALVSMVTMFIGAIVNILLDPLFIYVFDMGVRGAALATVIAQGCSLIWVLSFFITKKSPLALIIKNIRFNKPIIISIVTIGMAPFALQLAASLVQIILNKALFKYGGVTAQGSISVTLAVAMLFLMPIFGINQGVQPIIGYNYGAKLYSRVKKALYLAIIAASTITVVGSISIQLFADNYVKLFTKDATLISNSVTALRVYLFMLPIVGFQIVSANYFQCTGKPLKSMILSLSRQVLFLIPALYILPKIFKLNGVYAAAPVSDLLASLVTFILLMHEIKHLNNRHMELQRGGSYDEAKIY